MTSAVSVTTQELAPALLNSQANSPLATLPKGVFWKILLLLNLDDISAVSLTCKLLKIVSQDNHLWRALFNSRFPTPIPTGECTEEGDCLRAYQLYHHRHCVHENLKNGVYASRILAETLDVISLSHVDGKLISGLKDNTIKSWDLKSGECTATFEGHTERDSSILTDENQVYAPCYSTNTIKIWDAKSKQCKMTLEGHEGTVRSLIIVDGILISGSEDKTIRIWDSCTGTCLGVLEGHRGPVDSLLWVDGMLISGSCDKTIRTWNFSAPDRMIFAEIANQLRTENKLLFTLYSHAMTRFECMPEKARGQVYNEFFQILKPILKDLESTKSAFHGLQKTMERFSRMGIEKRDHLFGEELYEYLQPVLEGSEIVKQNAFHDLTVHGCLQELKAQAIENYLNSIGKEVKL